MLDPLLDIWFFAEHFSAPGLLAFMPDMLKFCQACLVNLANTVPDGILWQFLSKLMHSVRGAILRLRTLHVNAPIIVSSQFPLSPNV